MTEAHNRYIYQSYDAEPENEHGPTAIALHSQVCPEFQGMRMKGYVSTSLPIEEARRNAQLAIELFEGDGMTVVVPKCPRCKVALLPGPKPYLLDALTA